MRKWRVVVVVLAGCGLCGDEPVAEIRVAGERLTVVRRDCGATTGFAYVGLRERSGAVLFAEECNGFGGLAAEADTVTVRLRECRGERRREFAMGAAQVVVLSDTQK